MIVERGLMNAHDMSNKCKSVDADKDGAEVDKRKRSR